MVSSRLRALVCLALVGTAGVAHAFYLISPLSYWPANSVEGNIVFQVGLVPNGTNIKNPPLQDGSTTWDEAFVAQLNAWNAQIPDNVLHMTGVVGSSATPGEGDDVNNVFFSPDVYGDSWGASTSGICLSFWSGNRRTEADILFNSTKTWDAYTGNLQGNITDFRRVALHEIGHALLLDHPDDVGQSVPAIMNSTASNTDALTADDIAGVTTVYGALTPVTIAVQPNPVTIQSGSNAPLRVTAVGSEPMTFQWQLSTNDGSSWSDLDGADFPNGSFGPFLTGSNGDLLRVIVTNPVGSVTSRPVTLTVTSSGSAPAFVFDPVDTTISEGGQVIFTAFASGSPTPTYQWQYRTSPAGAWSNMFSSFGPTDAIGQNTPNLKMTQVNAAMNGYQFRVLANPGGSQVVSAIATLTVNAGPAPYFEFQPLDVHAQSGADVMIVAAVGGSPAPSRQWQRSTDGGTTWSNLSNGATFSGVTTATLSIADVTTAMSGHLFRLSATNSGGSATSREVALSVASANGAPNVTGDPADASVEAGENASFRVIATALPAPVYQWEMSPDGVTYWPIGDGVFFVDTEALETIVAGTNARTLTLTNIDQALDGFRFRVVVRNASGDDTSAAATLTIGGGSTAPSITTQPSDSSRLEGENATFTAAASGSPTPSLQWQRSTNSGSSWSNVSNNSTYSGATSATLTVTNVTTAMSGDQFRLVATNGVAPDATSNIATLTVANPSPPGVPGNPTVSASDYNALNAQWSAVSGATGYRIDVAMDESFTNLVSGYNNLDVGDVTSRVVPGLRLGTYYVRVRAYGAGGSSASSNSSSVEVGSRLVNLSTRGYVSSSSPMIVGFFVAEAPKSLLVRVAAARLSQAPFGLSGTLPNPRLRLVNQANGQEIAVNDDWDADDPDVVAAIQASGAGMKFVPGSVDSVIAAQDLPPGGYTAVVESVTGEPGIALVELYELDEVGRLINISTRGLTVAGGAEVMIGGTYVGPTAKRVLVRVVGETLDRLIAEPVVTDPVMELHISPATVVTNDDWDSNDSELAALWTSGSPTRVSWLPFASGSRDSALLQVLPARGGYTIIARSKNNVTGNVLIEIYEVP